jgi:hypothetical protein
MRYVLHSGPPRLLTSLWNCVPHSTLSPRGLGLPGVRWRWGPNFLQVKLLSAGQGRNSVYQVL